MQIYIIPPVVWLCVHMCPHKSVVLYQCIYNSKILNFTKLYFSLVPKFDLRFSFHSVYFIFFKIYTYCVFVIKKKFFITKYIVEKSLEKLGWVLQQKYSIICISYLLLLYIFSIAIKIILFIQMVNKLYFYSKNIQNIK